MSIGFPATSVTPLVAPLTNNAVALLNKPTVPPRSICATFNWRVDYGAGISNPNVNVLVNVLGAPGGAQQQMDAIRSVKIDNLGNDYTVYVYFLDSTDTIVAAPNTIVWEPVVTNSKIANVVLAGAQNSGLGQTRVYFCNVIVPPYVNAELSQAVALKRASPVISLAGGGAQLQSLIVLNGGLWQNGGNLSITGGGGNGATASGAVNFQGQFTATSLLTPGQNFTGQPIITNPNGTNAPIAYVHGPAYAAGVFVNVSGVVWQSNQPVPAGSSFFTNPGYGAYWNETALSPVPVSPSFAAVLGNPASGSAIQNNPFEPDTLGDQAIGFADAIANAGTGVFRNNLFGTPFGSGFIYLKAFNARITSVPVAATVAYELVNSDGVVLYSLEGQITPQELLNISGINQKLDATKIYSLNAVVVGGNVTLLNAFAWTYGNS